MKQQTKMTTNRLARLSLPRQICSQLARNIDLSSFYLAVVAVAAAISGPSVAGSPVNDGQYQARNLFESFMDAQVAEYTATPMDLCLSLAYQPATDGLADLTDATREPSDEAEDEERAAERVRAQMDKLTERLLEATEGQAGAKMRAALAETLNLRQLIKTAGPGNGAAERSLHKELGLDPMSRAKNNLLGGIKSAHLRSALDTYDLEQSIDLGPRLARRALALETLRHSLSGEQYREQVAGQVSETLGELGPDEQARLHAATLEAYGMKDDGRVTRRRKRDLAGLLSMFGGRELMRLVDRVLEVGLGLFDRFAATTEFVRLVPYLGDNVRAMRRRGEPIFKLVEHIRRLHYLFKVSRCPKEFKVENSSSSSSEMVVEYAGDDAELRQLAKFCRDHYDPERVRATVRVISEPAAQAVGALAKRLTSELTDHLADEVASRATYALMAWALPAASANPCQSPA